MAKKKRGTKEKKLRRDLEILKAQVRSYNKSSAIINTHQSAPISAKKDAESFKLPIKVIKKDLVKTISFATVSIIIVVFLKAFNVSFDTVAWAIKQIGF